MTNGETAKPPQGPQNSAYGITRERYNQLIARFQPIANVRGRGGPVGYGGKVELSNQTNYLMNFVTSFDTNDPTNKGAILLGCAFAMGGVEDRGMQEGICRYLEHQGDILSPLELQALGEFNNRAHDTLKLLGHDSMGDFIEDQVYGEHGLMYHAGQLENDGQSTGGLRIAGLALGAAATPDIHSRDKMISDIENQFVA